MTTVMALTLALAPGRVSAQMDDVYEKSLIAAHQALAQFGTVDDTERARRVEDIGYRVAQASRYQKYPFTFFLIDIPEPNAFALPGGQIFITKGMLALDLTDDELAALLGHEIAHVTARHSAQRQTRATGAGVLATIGTIGAAILGGQAAGQLAQQVTGVGAQAYLAGYSRDQELEADQLGIRYLARAGYEPRAMATFLEKLNDESELQRRLAGQEGEPGLSWFATHPRTLDRVEQAVAEIESETDGRLGREEYLRQIDGMIYGENPNQGVIRERAFIHPDLGFAFEAPAGFELVNTPQAVIGRDRQGRQMLFTLADTQGRDLDSYVAGPGLQQVARLAQAEVSAPRGVRSFTVNGMPAASASATLRQGNNLADVGLAAIDAGESVYQFIFISPGTMDADEARAYRGTVESFRRLDEREAASFDAKRIRVVPVESGQSAEQLASRMAVEAAPQERFVILNELALQDGLSPGERVKLVID